VDTIALLGDDAVAALREPGMTPDPEAAARFLAAVSTGGEYHAVDHTHPLNTKHRAGQRAAAACGEFARISRPRTVYTPVSWSLTTTPCIPCVWFTAIATGSTERVIRSLTPDREDAAQLAEQGIDALTAVKLARVILAGTRPGTPEPDPGMRTVTLLARLTVHAPAVIWDEACIYGDCGHFDGTCPRTPICRGCTGHAGSWAGEQEGSVLPGCLIRPPCSILQALASHHNVTQATSPFPPLVITGG
jgi:hypothetical protein